MKLRFNLPSASPHDDHSFCVQQKQFTDMSQSTVNEEWKNSGAETLLSLFFMLLEDIPELQPRFYETTITCE